MRLISHLVVGHSSYMVSVEKFTCAAFTCTALCCPEVLFKTCVAMKFVDNNGSNLAKLRTDYSSYLHSKVTTLE